MKIKSEIVNDIENKKDSGFENGPKLMVARSGGLVVLAYDFRVINNGQGYYDGFSGIVLYCSGIKKIGEVMDCWCSEFKNFDKSLMLKNVE